MSRLHRFPRFPLLMGSLPTGLLLAILTAGAALAAGKAATTPTKPSKAGSAASGAASKKAPAAEPAAFIGEEAIPMSAVEAAAAPDLEELAARQEGVRSSIAMEAWSIRRTALETIVDRTLIEREAAARGVSVADLEKAEIEDRAAPLTDAEKTAFYEKNKERFGSRSREEAMAIIDAGFRSQRTGARRAEFVEELRAKAGVRIVLATPSTNVALGTNPVLGPPSAPVTIVEFADYQCPYCQKAAPLIKDVRARYGDLVRIAFRDYPLPGHPFAAPAAAASRCAAEQGRYWEMHESLFGWEGALDDQALGPLAAKAGVDGAALKACMDSGRPAAAVRTDYLDGLRAGVDGTPAFFINGVLLSGAQPLEAFVAVIDGELQRKGIAAPAAPADPAAAAENSHASSRGGSPDPSAPPR